MALGCEGNDLPILGPDAVPLGQTAFVVLVNPTVNLSNKAMVPPIGAFRSGVAVGVVGGPAETTDRYGIAALTPVTAGSKTVTLPSGQFAATIADKDVRDLFIAWPGSTAALMTEVTYPFGGTLVDAGSLNNQQINAELAKDSLVVYLPRGNYAGNLNFAGNGVSVYAEGAAGGLVTLNGNVNVTGSNNRLRGVRVLGNVAITGNGFSMTYGRVDGTTQALGADIRLLRNALCGTVTVTGANLMLLDNAGPAPIPKESAGC
jgi:hypothetical protein